MGYYNPIYIYGVDELPRRRQGGRRRRPDRRRPAARGGRGAVPAGAQGRAQLHPPRDADHRRQAPAGGAREHLGLRLLRLDHRHHRLGRARRRQGRTPRSTRIKRHTKLPVAVGFGVRTAEQARAIAEGADGVVVGSALVDAVQGQPRQERQGDGAHGEGGDGAGGGAGRGRARGEAQSAQNMRNVIPACAGNPSICMILIQA